MKAMVLVRSDRIENSPLQLMDMRIPEPGPGELRIRVSVCGVCRTDLHVAEGDLPRRTDRIIPGHEIVGIVDALGQGCARFGVGDRVGAAWLFSSCGACPYCLRHDENLCVNPTFTGYDVNGGYAEYVVAREDFVYALPPAIGDAELAPFLCAGIIGYRSLRRSRVGPGQAIGLYGFGASAHLVLQIARHWNCPVYVMTRDTGHRELAMSLGATWAGAADATPPVKLRAAILFAPAGELVPAALTALDRGATLALAGITMSAIPEMDYGKCLFQERSVCSVTANTREDGRELLRLAAKIPLHSHTREFPLEQANEALRMLKHDQIDGAAVLRIAA